MHDLNYIRSSPREFDHALAKRGHGSISSKILQLDEQRRRFIRELEMARATRNEASRRAGSARAGNDHAEFERLRAVQSSEREQISKLETNVSAVKAELRELLLGIPNLPLEDVPVGEDESQNVELRRWGEIPNFDFVPLEHFQIPAAKTGMDFEIAAKLSGSRFCVLSGSMARLHRALAQFMIDVHIKENGLTEVWTPVLVNPEIMVGAGQLPKFADESYKTTNDKWLIPTAEVTLANIVRDAIIEKGYLPRRYCAHTQCFRSESGAAGRDTAGMLRQHQFEKVEMVSVTTPENSPNELERMLSCAEGILKKLGICFRTVVLCTGDMGFGARMTYDLEVWLPGQENFREISSVSTCGDFQARRMNARMRSRGAQKPRFVHTLNGSGLAVGRTLIAILENGQQRDGGVILPEVLAPYLDGMTSINNEGEFA